MVDSLKFPRNYCYKIIVKVFYHRCDNHKSIILIQKREWKVFPPKIIVHYIKIFFACSSIVIVFNHLFFSDFQIVGQNCPEVEKFAVIGHLLFLLNKTLHPFWSGILIPSAFNKSYALVNVPACSNFTFALPSRFSI